MIRLQPRRDAAGEAERVVATHHHANLSRGDHQIHVAHQLTNRGHHLRREAWRDRQDLLAARPIVEQPFAEFPDGHGGDRPTSVAHTTVLEQAGELILLVGNGWRFEQRCEWHLGENAFGGHAFAIRRGA